MSGGMTQPVEGIRKSDEAAERGRGEHARVSTEMGRRLGTPADIILDENWELIALTCMYESICSVLHETMSVDDADGKKEGDCRYGIDRVP